jgi:S-adenosylmethionine decarboxylase
MTATAGHLLVGKGFTMNALARLGMVSDFPSDAQTTCNAAAATTAEVQKDYFIERDGVRFAGMHLLVDLWEATSLDDPERIDAALRAGAEAAGATILHGHFHHFSPNGGVSGVLVLAESHISIHTWPERGYAAIDIFMCGACDPALALPHLQAAFSAGRVEVSEQRRGVIA